MAWRMKEARLLNKMTVEEARAKLEISQPTLSAWEAGRKSPSIESLEKMADLYGVTTDYLLGRPDVSSPVPSQPLNAKLIPVLDGMPVWSARYGWLLVNARERQLLRSSGEAVSFGDVGELYVSPETFASSVLPSIPPLNKSMLLRHTEVWVEPISADPHLREELRGWYRLIGGYAENQNGNRFSFDSYEAKWLAFEESPLD